MALGTAQRTVSAAIVVVAQTFADVGARRCVMVAVVLQLLLLLAARLPAGGTDEPPATLKPSAGATSAPV
jgi:hypothetical protein